MPAVSKSQQQLMGMVHACQKGEKCASPKVKKIAKTIKPGDAEEFASTKHEGLPKKKKKGFKEWLAENEAKLSEVSTGTNAVATFARPTGIGMVTRGFPSQAYCSRCNRKVKAGGFCDTCQA